VNLQNARCNDKKKDKNKKKPTQIKEKKFLFWKQIKRMTFNYLFDLLMSYNCCRKVEGEG
jgi:hypothetical protein